MSVIKFKPTSAGKRGTVKVKPDGLWKGRPLRKLVEPKKQLMAGIVLVILQLGIEVEDIKDFID